MKRLLILYVLIISTLGTFAQHHHYHNDNSKNYNEGRTKHSKLVIRTWDDRFFVVKVDGILYNKPTTRFVLKNIRQGNHFIVVLRRRNGQRVRLYKGTINVPRHSKVIVNISRHHEAYLDIIDFYKRNNQDTNIENWTDDDYYNDDWENDDLSDYYDDENGYYENVLPPLNFVQLSIALANATFDSDKLAISQQAVRLNAVTANQVARMVSLLSFESSKLALAKAAYYNCIDKNNYYLVNSSFDFSSSIRELNNFIINNNNH